jgi:hypothetical protein
VLDVTPVPATPDVDLDEDPTLGDGPSLQPPEIDCQSEPPREEEVLPRGPGAHGVADLG